MSTRNLFCGKDLLSQFSEFYHELKRMTGESKTPVVEEAEKEINNERAVLQEDSCSFMVEARCVAPRPATCRRIALPLPVHHLFAEMPHRSLLHSALLCSQLLLPNPSTFQWNTIIRTCSSRHFPRESLNLFHKMRQKSTTPDAYTFQFMFKSCGLVGSTLEGKMVHALFIKHFPDCDMFVANSLVYMYVQLDYIDDAVTVFRLINMKDVVSWMAIIGGLVKSRFVDEARKLFNEMPMRNVVSWTSLIDGYAKNGRASDVIFNIILPMREENFHYPTP
ncbi:hypothetical protein ZIOFF_048635 [Zingiber officinale]|uniref:Pentatricopeptide repeat-containing protein n=1 Tax=Zingiber officinale TaxID=94328 RepID=A0A8J5FWX0_ZINOF|nr:hypothetical protein ZIOFF_048635 [Zingiber officinale]